MENKRFNLRVYGIFVKKGGKVLLSTESRKGMTFTKFPGGGLQWGEGLNDCLKREIREELGIECKIKELFYLTEHFQESAFSSNDQLISVYYLLESPQINSITNGRKSLDPEEADNHFYWHDLEDLVEDSLTFPIDREVLDLLKQQ